MMATSITLLTQKIRDNRWDAFADAFYRLNMATEVEIDPGTLQSALDNAGIKSPKELSKLLELVSDNKYLCMTFDVVEGSQTITFTGTEKPIKVEAPKPL